jgi:hypothetical protein
LSAGALALELLHGFELLRKGFAQARKRRDRSSIRRRPAGEVRCHLHHREVQSDGLRSECGLSLRKNLREVLEGPDGALIADV